MMIYNYHLEIGILISTGVVDISIVNLFILDLTTVVCCGQKKEYRTYDLLLNKITILTCYFTCFLCYKTVV